MPAVPKVTTVSANGAVVLSGKGLAAVRLKITQAFNQAVHADAEFESVEVAEHAAPEPAKPLRPLAETVAPVMRVAQRQLAEMRLELQKHRVATHVSLPTNASYEQLIDAALKVISEGEKR